MLQWRAQRVDDNASIGRQRTPHHTLCMRTALRWRRETYTSQVTPPDLCNANRYRSHDNAALINHALRIPVLARNVQVERIRSGADGAAHAAHEKHAACAVVRHMTVQFERASCNEWALGTRAVREGTQQGGATGSLLGSSSASWF